MRLFTCMHEQQAGISLWPWRWTAIAPPHFRPSFPLSIAHELTCIYALTTCRARNSISRLLGLIGRQISQSPNRLTWAASVACSFPCIPWLRLLMQHESCKRTLSTVFATLAGQPDVVYPGASWGGGWNEGSGVADPSFTSSSDPLRRVCL